MCTGNRRRPVRQFGYGSHQLPAAEALPVKPRGVRKWCTALALLAALPA
ncbi:hypothetical protein RM555_00015 [Micromonospora sp. DSM 115977]|uniref:Uncharacterized protein n=1 Tax=Micromonospora reichwaldensis TaxID=3075516 RepID=A0ABU2WN91_9ACTN|nr:hypothetical protein [Micromonospora sp. DSM 115977]MDT0527373.1 hypothetical protein [Micromonospora sp. DSM 115977]